MKRVIAVILLYAFATAGLAIPGIPVQHPEQERILITIEPYPDPV